MLFDGEEFIDAFSIVVVDCKVLTSVFDTWFNVRPLSLVFVMALLVLVQKRNHSQYLQNTPHTHKQTRRTVKTWWHTAPPCTRWPHTHHTIDTGCWPCRCLAPVLDTTHPHTINHSFKWHVARGREKGLTASHDVWLRQNDAGGAAVLDGEVDSPLQHTPHLSSLHPPLFTSPTLLAYTAPPMSHHTFIQFIIVK